MIFFEAYPDIQTFRSMATEATDNEMAPILTLHILKRLCALLSSS